MKKILALMICAFVLLGCAATYRQDNADYYDYGFELPQYQLGVIYAPPGGYWRYSINSYYFSAEYSPYDIDFVPRYFSFYYLNGYWNYYNYRYTAYPYWRWQHRNHRRGWNDNPRPRGNGHRIKPPNRNRHNPPARPGWRGQLPPEPQHRNRDKDHYRGRGDANMRGGDSGRNNGRRSRTTPPAKPPAVIIGEQK